MKPVIYCTTPLIDRFGKWGMHLGGVTFLMALESLVVFIGHKQKETGMKQELSNEKHK